MIFQGRTAGDVWESSIRSLLNTYHEGNLSLIPTQHNVAALELTDVLLNVTAANSRNHDSPHYLNKEWARRYVDELLNQKSTGHVYTRLTKLPQESGLLDQETAIVEELRKCWFTRRAVMSIWQPSDDIASEYPPCVCMLQFLIREDALHLYTYFRSNDAWTCALPDMIGFIKYQKRIARKLRLPAATYSQHSVSYHIYEHDLPLASHTFGKGS